MCELLESELPWDLLLTADPSLDQIKTYIGHSRILGLKDNGALIGVVVLLHSGGEIEIKNLAVAKFFQKQGFGKFLVNAAIEVGKEMKVKIITIGTGNSGLNQLGRCQKCGFKSLV